MELIELMELDFIRFNVNVNVNATPLLFSIQHDADIICIKAVEKNVTSTMEELSELEQDVLAGSSNIKAEPFDKYHEHGQSVKREAMNGSAMDVSMDMDGGNPGGQSGVGGDQIVLDGAVVSGDDVQGMKKQIDDLGLVNESREKRILEVRYRDCYRFS